MLNNPEFNTAYRLHQPPEVRAMMDEPDETKRLALALQLAQKGFAIDGPIMVMGLDPYKVMSLRIMYGMWWEPPLGAPPIILSPGPGETATNFNEAMPKGYIRNTAIISDYPPFDPPLPPAVAPAAKSYVGQLSAFGIYVSMAGDPLLSDPTADGREVDDPRGKFIYHRSLFGGYYTKK